MMIGVAQVIGMNPILRSFFSSGPAPSAKASVAQTLYRETEASRELRLKVAAERKAMKQFEELPAGRPSKRDRRKIIQFRGRA